MSRVGRTFICSGVNRSEGPIGVDGWNGAAGVRGLLGMVGRLLGRGRREKRVS
jgi:hypothetical protein